MVLHDLSPSNQIGGSQVPGAVADAVRDYMVSNYVQLGADYPVSRRATG